MMPSMILTASGCQLCEILYICSRSVLMLISTHLVSCVTDVWCSHMFGVCDPKGLCVCVQVSVYAPRSAGKGHCKMCISKVVAS